MCETSSKIEIEMFFKRFELRANQMLIKKLITNYNLGYLEPSLSVNIY
jgi:hypothetical protein